MNLKTTDQLLEMYYHIKDRQVYRRNCGLSDNSNDMYNEYKIIDELASRGINIVEINATLIA